LNIISIFQAVKENFSGLGLGLIIYFSDHKLPEIPIYIKTESKEATVSDVKKRLGAPLNTIWVNGTMKYYYVINVN
jgi:hypothetical protein